MVGNDDNGVAGVLVGIGDNMGETTGVTWLFSLELPGAVSHELVPRL